MEHEVYLQDIPTPFPVWFRHETDYERFHPHTGNLIIKGRTVAYIELGAETLEAYAECSILDTYSKRRGRTVAEGRLKAALANKIKMQKYLEHNPPKFVPVV